MSRVFRNLSRSSSSRSLGSNSESTSSSCSYKNKEIVTIENVEKHLHNWDIPRVSTTSVYNQGSFKFKSDYVIKTVEEVLPVTGDILEVPLISEKLINTYREKYGYLHLGMVQIAIKPLTREGLNNSVLTCIRDKRHRNFSDSLLGCIESTLSEGPIYFNCFPNFTVHLGDKHVTRSLMVDLKTHGFNMEEGSSNLALIYRVYCKVMNTITPDINLRSLIRDQKGETTVFQTNLAKSKLAIPRKIPWSEITFPDTWTLENTVPTQPTRNTQLNQVVDLGDGSVVIQFDGQRSIKMLPSRLPSRPSDYTSSFQSSPQPSRLLPESRRDASLLGTQEEPEGVSIPVYQTQHPASPTPSDMGYANICVLERQRVSWDRITEMFNSEENREIRTWFLARYDREQKDFLHKKYEAFLDYCQEEFDFFEFFRRYCSLYKIPIPEFPKASTSQQQPQQQQQQQQPPQQNTQVPT